MRCLELCGRFPWQPPKHPFGLYQALPENLTFGLTSQLFQVISGMNRSTPITPPNDARRRAVALPFQLFQRAQTSFGRHAVGLYP
jgi:hypothetical protein